MSHVYITFDIEVLPNCFLCSFYNTKTGEIHTFEISKRKNEVRQLTDYVTEHKTDHYFVGYNCIHYDTPILNMIIASYYNEVTDWSTLTKYAKDLSDIITKKDEMSEIESKNFKFFKYLRQFDQIDLLTMLYSTKLRVGLKWMQVTMHYENVLEMQIDWDDYIEESKIDELIQYNINDIKSTAYLLDKVKDKLELRFSIKSKYNIDVLSTDDVNLGTKLLKHLYCSRTGHSEAFVDTLRSPCDTMDLSEIIMPQIAFKSPVLKAALHRMKTAGKVSPGRKGYIDTFVFAGMKTTIGVGGIHGDCGAGNWQSDENTQLWDSDVSSLYPSLMCVYGFYPPHLGKEFIEIYSEIKDERLKAKREGNVLINESYKLILNGTSGLLQQEHSWLYSPYTAMQIRINGQLLLLMLAEELHLAGCSLKQINTDGILYAFDISIRDKVLTILGKWESFTKLQLETDSFKAFYQLAINDYLGVLENGKVKEKGYFITKTLLGKGLAPTIIPIAIREYLVNNTSVRETITSEQDIKKFLIGEKTGKQWTVTYGGNNIQHINRWYVSDTSGFYLDKIKEQRPSKSALQMTQFYEDVTDDYVRTYGKNPFKETDSLSETRLNHKPVILLNKFDNKTITERRIDYNYYISAANKIIEQIKPSQLTLF